MSLNIAWMSYDRGKAHLVIDQFVIDTDKRQTSICGVAVDKPAPYLARCVNCADTLRELAEVATQEPPKRIREHVWLEVTRNAEGEPIEEVLRRKLKPYTSITIESIKVEDLGAVKEEE